MGVALATIAHAQLAETEGISLTAISSAGSLENVKLLRDNQVQFAILQGPFGAWSWAAKGPVSSPQTPYAQRQRPLAERGALCITQ